MCRGFISDQCSPEASRLTVTIIRNIGSADRAGGVYPSGPVPDILDPANNDKYAQIPATGAVFPSES